MQAAEFPVERDNGASQERGPLRIALVTETYPPEVNGVAHTLKQMVTGLLQRGHRVQLVRPRQRKDETPCREEAFEELLRPGLPIPFYRELRLGLPSRAALTEAWREFRPHILYIATEGPLGTSALKAGESLGIPAVSGYHTNFDHYSRYYRIGFLEPLVQRFLKRFHNRTRSTLVPTEAMRETLESRGIDNGSVISRGVDGTLFNPARRSRKLRSDWDLGERGLAVIYVGRLAAEKNLDLTVDAFRAIQKRQPDARLILIGDGPAAADLRSRHPDLLFTGLKRGEELAVHYASGDIFLFPSLTETFGNVVTEAMASGLAVVSFDYAAGREHIRHEMNGLLAPFGDREAFIAQADKLADAPERIEELGRQARATAEKLDWQFIHDRLEEMLYRHAAAADPLLQEMRP